MSAGGQRLQTVIISTVCVGCGQNVATFRRSKRCRACFYKSRSQAPRTNSEAAKQICKICNKNNVVFAKKQQCMTCYRKLKAECKKRAAKHPTCMDCGGPKESEWSLSHCRLCAIERKKEPTEAELNALIEAQRATMPERFWGDDRQSTASVPPMPRTKKVKVRPTTRWGSDDPLTPLIEQSTGGFTQSLIKADKWLQDESAEDIQVVSASWIDDSVEIKYRDRKGEVQTKLFRNPKKPKKRKYNLSKKNLSLGQIIEERRRLRQLEQSPR